MTTAKPSTVLVSAASKHGATAEIAARIGDVLKERGLDVTVAPPDVVDDPAAYDAVILGSAVYAGRWRPEARELAERLAGSTSQRQVWLFSSGPVGDPPKPEEDPVDVAAIVESLSARGHEVFAGKIDKSVLGFGERAVVAALRAPEGDFRDWDHIADWTGRVADSLAFS